MTNPERSRLPLLAAIPLTLLAASLACSGPAWRGCTPFCTFVKLAWTPLLALGCGVYFFRPGGRLLALLGLASLVPLAPHCICTNPVNRWWVSHLGTSPMCYAAGTLVALIAVAALRGAVRPRLALAANYGILGGIAAFFVGHHFYRFPW